MQTLESVLASMDQDDDGTAESDTSEDDNCKYASRIPPGHDALEAGENDRLTADGHRRKEVDSLTCSTGLPRSEGIPGQAFGGECIATSNRAEDKCLPPNNRRGCSARQTLEQNRTDAKRAWKCVQMADTAARVLPPLSVQALLPACVVRAPHSCAPTVRVPAGHPREYNSGHAFTGAGGGRPDSMACAGVSGNPLTVAAVALQDIPAGTDVTMTWVDSEAQFSTRSAMLSEYTAVNVADDLAKANDCCETRSSLEEKFRPKVGSPVERGGFCCTCVRCHAHRKLAGREVHDFDACLETAEEALSKNR